MANRDDGYVVDDKRPFMKNGKRVGTMVFLRNQSTQAQKVRVYLNPYGKARKYALENKDKRHYTNLGVPKEEKPFSREAQAYRSGYIDALKDERAVWKAKKKGPKNRPK